MASISMGAGGTRDLDVEVEALAAAPAAALAHLTSALARCHAFTGSLQLPALVPALDASLLAFLKRFSASVSALAAHHSPDSATTGALLQRPALVPALDASLLSFLRRLSTSVSAIAVRHSPDSATSDALLQRPALVPALDAHWVSTAPCQPSTRLCFRSSDACLPLCLRLLRATPPSL